VIGKVENYGYSLFYPNFQSPQQLNSLKKLTEDQMEQIISLLGKMPEEMRKRALSEIRSLFALSKAQEVTYQTIIMLINSLNQSAGGESSISIYA